MSPEEKALLSRLPADGTPVPAEELGERGIRAVKALVDQGIVEVLRNRHIIGRHVYMGPPLKVALIVRFLP